MLIVVARRDQQRAEYLADEMSARVAGTEAAVALADSLLVVDSLAFAVSRGARASADVAVWRAAAEQARAANQPRIDPLRQLSIRDQVGLFATHPATGLRVRLLRSRQAQQAAVALTDAESGRIDEELAARYVDARRQLAESVI